MEEQMPELLSKVTDEWLNYLKKCVNEEFQKRLNINYIEDENV